MTQKFNGGYGAYICDECATILRYGRPGAWRETVKAPAFVIPIDDQHESALEFCSVKCAHKYSKRRNAFDVERVRRALNALRG